MSINREMIGPDVWASGEPPAYGWVPPGTANYEGVRPICRNGPRCPMRNASQQAAAIMAKAGYTPDKPLPGADPLQHQ